MTLKNAFGDLALDRPSANGDAHMVSGTKVRWRKEFNDPTLADWDVVTGSGMAINVTGGTLTATTGTTTNSTTTITSKQMFTAPFKTAFGFKISQKITNQEFYMELVKCNPTTGVVDETVVAAWRIAGSDSTTTTVARAEVRNGGAARTQSANVTVPTQTTDAIYEIILESDEVSFHTKTINSTSSRTGSTVFNSVAPDPTATFKLRYRIVNGGTAPASTTTFTAQFVTAVDYTEIQTEIAGGPGNTMASSSMPVNITGGSVGVSNATIGASASTTGTSVTRIQSTAGTNATLIKSTAGRVYGYQLANTSASWRYVKFYNLTTAPTVGTSTLFYTVPLAPNSSTDFGLVVPVSHGTGISIAITTGPGQADTGAVGADEIHGYIMWI